MAVRWHTAGATVAFTLASVSLLLAAALATSGEGIAIPKFLAFAASSIPFLMAAVALLVLAQQHRRSELEALRLSRQLAVLEAYVASLPRNARALVLASLAPRFFPQHQRADDELLVEHDYPPSDQLLISIDPAYAAAFSDDDDDD
ncbi:MAG: hypothetical protein AB7W59_13195 [Acidimicrobiia bacterium]